MERNSQRFFQAHLFQALKSRVRGRGAGDCSAKFSTAAITNNNNDNDDDNNNNRHKKSLFSGKKSKQPHLKTMLLLFVSLAWRKSVGGVAALIDFWVSREVSLRAPHEFDTPVAHHQWLQPPSHCPRGMPTCCTMMECYYALSTFELIACLIHHSHYFRSSVSVPSTGEWLSLPKVDLGDPFLMQAPFVLHVKIC